MQMFYVLVGVLLFGILVMVHEFGHFIVAKLCGVCVNEFSVGMGPCVYQRQKGETMYSLRCVPFGGYCAFDNEEANTNPERLFEQQGFIKKTLILVAGSAVNFLFGVLLMLGLYSDATGFYTATITAFAPEFDTSVALEVGDTFYRIDGERVYLYSDLSTLFSMGDGVSFDIQVIRNGEKVLLEDVPLVRKEYTDAQGDPYTGYGLLFGEIEEGTLGNKIKNSWNTALGFVRTVRLSLEMLTTGEAGMEDLSGPVGIVDTISQVGAASENVRIAFENMFYFAALLSVNLAVMNMLPLPGLDGGRIFILVIDCLAVLLFGKKVPEQYVNAVNTMGFFLLMAFILCITFKDVFVLFQ